MSEPVWEDLIALNSRHVGRDVDVVGPAQTHYDANSDEVAEWIKAGIDFEAKLPNDPYELPTTADREGYYGPQHLSYWASGLRDLNNLLAAADRLGVDVKTFFDIGCASGRVVRHFSAQRPDIETIGSDINRKHIDWMIRYLSKKLIVFQNHSIPSIPLPDNSVDLISAFSVFTHIEAFEGAWLMELRRILRPGGIAWVTVHTEHTWLEMEDDWPLYRGTAKHPDFAKYDRTEPFPDERLVFRWHSNRSYSSNTFYKTDYIRENWARYLDVAEVHRRLPGYQDVVVLRKS
ncbi:MAG: class I SAM-dependent methyltransferase [Pseudomonadota bacterium]